MTAKIILNPYAGRWKAQQAIPDVQRACEQCRLDYKLEITEGPAHAIELARQALLSGYSPLVCAGGDGSISEVVNGMLQATAGEQPQAPLGIIPLGSADDLANMLELPADILSACQAIAGGKERLLDLGRVNGRYFDNNSAVGLEPMVTLTQERMTRIKGTPRYILAALRTIAAHRPWRMHLTWDGGECEGDLVLVSVGNTRRTGGAFYMTPQAEPDDGLLDFVFAVGMSRGRLLQLLPTTFNGRHVEQEGIHYERTTRLTITCDPPTPIQADGEIFERTATTIRYEILPARLKVLVPAAA